MVGLLLLISQKTKFSPKYDQQKWSTQPNNFSSNPDLQTPNRDPGNYDCPKKPLPWVLEVHDTDERNELLQINCHDFNFESDCLDLWSPNICFLMKRILDQKKILVQYQEDKNSVIYLKFDNENINASLNEMFKMSGEYSLGH